MTGILLLVTVGIVYFPSAMKNGMYEFELTFLSNTIVGLIFLCGGIYGLIKKRNLPQPLYCNGILLLQMVFLNCMAFIGEFNFSGGYIFLHIVNPLLATVVFFTCTSCMKMPGFKLLLSALLFPVAYLIYVITYGYLSGYWLYGILNIPEKGTVFVTILVFAVAIETLLLEWIQYKINYLSSRNRIHKGFYRNSDLSSNCDQ
jgi:hypothetical protein